MEERLTEKDIYGIAKYRLKFCGNGAENQIKCLNKMGELEDLEQELGIDLKTLVRILKAKRVYDKFYEYGYTLDDGNLQVSIEEKCVYNIVFADYGKYDQCLYFEDYGKTWALTKKELEK